ncbi:glutathione peroxidase 4 [Spatholobus suberectus]|nr:glutathione peroxidase 4 [Spatholobus suberectus]
MIPACKIRKEKSESSRKSLDILKTHTEWVLRNQSQKIPSMNSQSSGFADANYTQLTQLYTTYKSRGLEILAFPCNQFLKKEPGTSQEAQEFACTRYKAEYPIFGKIRVNGSDSASVYKFLKAQKSGFLGSRIKWNFTKFLVDEAGRVIQRYSPTTKPFAIENDIKKALRVA